MPLVEAFKLALQSLWANKMRTVLTLIGVVMGVASVIMVITLVQGAKRYISTKLSGYGADVFEVTRMPSVILTPKDYFKYHKRKIIRIEDYRAVRADCADCAEVGAELTRTATVVYNGHSSDNTVVRGYTWTMLALNNINIVEGRGFTPADENHATYNAIVGYDIVANLLGPVDPIGKVIRADGIQYTIVGVAQRQGTVLGQSQDNWVAVPITTYQQIYGADDSVNIYARAKGGAEGMEQAEDEVRVVMRTLRHDAPGAADDFELVLLQFLMESASMALAGGLFGVLGGILVGKLITLIIGFPTAVPLWAIFLGLFLATSVGIFFGVYPASKAARLDPVTALRAEM